MLFDNIIDRMGVNAESVKDNKEIFLNNLKVHLINLAKIELERL